MRPTSDNGPTVGPRPGCLGAGERGLALLRRLPQKARPPPSGEPAGHCRSRRLACGLHVSRPDWQHTGFCPKDTKP
jgi:hypothetical protein